MPAPLQIPPPAPPAPLPPAVMPFPNIAAAPLDMTGDNDGIAQQTAREKKLQARILWIDATANIGRYNTVDQIHGIVSQAKASGFNELVLDVKPIIGYTIYPSHLASKLADWKQAQLPPDFDPLAVFVKEAHAAGLTICANMAVFSEGHKYFSKGLGYTQPKMQTVLYEPIRTVRTPVLYSPELTIAETQNALSNTPGTIAVYTDMSSLHRPIPGALAIVTDFMGRVLAQIDGSYLGNVTLSTPTQGAVLVAEGSSADSIRATTHVGDLLKFASTARYVPIAADTNQKIALFVNPNDPDVQQHEFNLLKEIVCNYDVDGIIFDDRLRFAGINADFSETSKQQFDKYVGRTLKWPDDVFQYNPYPNQDIIKGPEYQAWIVWRALTIRNWLADARAIVKHYRPRATVSVYAGSWYGEYGDLGENWASDDYDGKFDFNTKEWRETGFAGLLDWITTGCYYSTATISEGNLNGNPGTTVEAAGQLSNQAVDDQTWTYAGLYADQFSDKNDDFAKALQAAAASTQGIMIFDISQLYSNHLWPIVAQAFAQPAEPPHKDPELLASVRSQHKTGVDVIAETLLKGKSGTGL